MVHKGPLVQTAADSFILKAVVTGEREKFLCLEISFDSSFFLKMEPDVMSLI